MLLHFVCPDREASVNRGGANRNAAAALLRMFGVPVSTAASVEVLKSPALLTSVLLAL
mgnify:CR=1 FL=1